MRVLSPAFGGIPIHVAYQSKEVTDLSPAPNADCRNATRIGRNLHSKIDHYTPFWDWTGSVFPGHGTDWRTLQLVAPVQFKSQGAMSDESSDEEPYETSGAEEEESEPVQRNKAAELAASMSRWIATGTIEAPSSHRHACLRRRSTSGQHGGTTVASRSKRDARNLGLHEGNSTTLSRSTRTRKPIVPYVAESAVCFTRNKAPTQLIDESWETEAPSVPVSRSDKERERRQAFKTAASHVNRARVIAERQAAEVAELVSKSDEIFVKFSWRERKELAISSFAKARSCGYSKMTAYLVASFGARVSQTTVRIWIKAWQHGDDGFFSCNKGTNTVRSNLSEPDVMALATQWWLDHAPRKGSCSHLLTARFKNLILLALTTPVRLAR